MSSITVRGSKLYAKVKAPDGTWRRVATGYDDTPEGRKQARVMVADLERRAAAECELAKVGMPLVPRAMTVRAYADRWVEERRALDLDWKHDRGRLEHHVLPIIGDMLITDVRTRHLVELFTSIRTKPRDGQAEVPSQRTIYNIYSAVAAMFRDAKLADVIEQTPCCLTSRQLGPKRDKDPEWRASAVFGRDEAETIISTPMIPLDRRMGYALELLAGVRPGEAAALRWRHYDAVKQPLGELLVALAYSTKKNRAKGTKTETVKHVPVHPTLAAMLAEWKLAGWAAMMGRAPEPDDLIVPMPPEDAKARTKRGGDEAFRTYYYSGRRWRADDLPALGWRARRHYDMRATFITLALEDGADPHVIETRVTHTKRSRSAFDGYNRGRQWAITCAEVAKLRIVRREQRGQVLAFPMAMAASGGGGNTRNPDDDNASRGPSVVQSPTMATVSTTSGLRRRVSNERDLPRSSTREEPNRDVAPSSVADRAESAAGVDHGVVQSIAAELDDAASAWRTEGDASALRRALLHVLAKLE